MARNRGFALIAAVAGVMAVVVTGVHAATVVNLIRNPGTDNAKVVRGDGNSDRIKMTWIGDRRFEVVSANRARGDRCQRIDLHRIKCLRGPGVAFLELYGGAGADRLSLRGRFPSALAGITGNAGPDHIHGSRTGEVLTGSQGDDQISGGPGADNVDGESSNAYRPPNPGDDTLRGGPGRDEVGDYYELGVDRFFGGPGRDVVDATDRAADRAINGGPGADLCRVDRVDPKAKDCERVKVVPPSPHD